MDRVVTKQGAIGRKNVHKPALRLGGFSEIQLAPDIYRVSFSPYGYIPWDLAYQAGLLHCATLAIQNGYRYFGVLTIENYGSGNSFSLPGNSYTYGTSDARGFYNPKRPIIRHRALASYGPNLF